MEKAFVFREGMDLSSASQRETIIKRFSENNSLSLNLENFKNLLSELVTDSNGKSYELSHMVLEKLFITFDVNKDGVIDTSEFTKVANDFIKPLLKPVIALLVIDVQNDFIEGSLALKNCPSKQDGFDVVSVINNLIDKHKFDVVAYTYDWHPKDHISFFENLNLYELSEKNKPSEKISCFDTVLFKGPPEMLQDLWPTHCVQNTWGSELHKDLRTTNDPLKIYKGTNSLVDSYSAFFDNKNLSKTVLHDKLKERNVTHVFICGLAFDYCVSYTALDSVNLGYATVVVQDATRGTDNSKISSMEKKLKSYFCVLADSCEIENIKNGKDVKAEFAISLQQTLNKHCPNELS